MGRSRPSDFLVVWVGLLERFILHRPGTNVFVAYSAASRTRAAVEPVLS